MSNVLVVGGMKHYYKPFEMFGAYCEKWSSREKPLFAIFTGGEDVSPALYGEPVGMYTSYSEHRDKREKEIFEELLFEKVPMLGICRGSQFLCVMSGGKLAQHVKNHANGNQHDIKTDDDRIISVTSTHHQMQLPPNDAKVIAWAYPRLSQVYLNGDNKPIDDVPYEYEAVYYPNTNALGCQWHPEFMQDTDEGFLYCQELVQKYLL